MKKIAAIACATSLLLPGVALAGGGSSTCSSYSPQTCNVLNGTQPNSASRSNGSPSASNTSAATDTASALPFTGLDVVLLVVGGGTLMAGGLVVRRLSRDPQ